MLKFRSLIILPCLLALTGGITANASKSTTMNITTKKTYPITLNGDAVTVIIGDSDVADVSAPTERLVLLSGVGPGSTNLLILDENNKEILNLNVVVGYSAANILTIRRGTATSTRYICTDQCAPQDAP